MHIVGDGPKKFLLSQSVSEFSHRLGPQRKSRPKETANQSGPLLRWNCPTYGEAFCAKDALRRILVANGDSLLESRGIKHSLHLIQAVKLNHKDARLSRCDVPDPQQRQILREAGLSWAGRRGAGTSPHLASVLQEGRESANIFMPAWDSSGDSRLDIRPTFVPNVRP